MTRRALALALALALLPAAGLAKGKDAGGKGEKVCPAPVHTPFDPARDGLPYVNYGDFASPLGNCWGMSLLAVHDYQLRQAGGLEAIPPELVHSVLEADVLQQIVASLVQEQAIETTATGSGENARLPVDDPSGVRAALERLRSSQVPEILCYDNRKSGHANVLYGFDGLALLIYDPNYPGETIRWPWSAQEGLGKHPKGGSFYGTITHLSSTPFAQFTVSARLAALRESCVSRELACVGRFPGISGRLHVSADGKPVIVGRITRPELEGEEEPPELGEVWATINGQPMAHTRIKHRLGRNVYALVLPKGTQLDASRQVRVVLMTEDGRFAGYQDVSARPDSVMLPPPAPTPTPAPTPAPTPMPGPDDHQVIVSPPAPTPTPAPLGRR